MGVAAAVQVAGVGVAAELVYMAAPQGGVAACKLVVESAVDAAWVGVVVEMKKQVWLVVGMLLKLVEVYWWLQAIDLDDLSLACNSAQRL